MRTIYIDSDFKCHVSDDGTMTAVKTGFFDGKCVKFVEGYCCKINEDGKPMFPWKPYSELAAAQEQYEKDLLERADLEAAYNYLLTGGIA